MRRKMSFVGYARVSSIGQSLDLQLEKLSNLYEDAGDKVRYAEVWLCCMNR